MMKMKFFIQKYAYVKRKQTDKMNDSTRSLVE